MIHSRKEEARETLVQPENVNVFSTAAARVLGWLAVQRPYDGCYRISLSWVCGFIEGIQDSFTSAEIKRRYEALWKEGFDVVISYGWKDCRIYSAPYVLWDYNPSKDEYGQSTSAWTWSRHLFLLDLRIYTSWIVLLVRSMVPYLTKTLHKAFNWCAQRDRQWFAFTVIYLIRG